LLVWIDSWPLQANPQHAVWQVVGKFNAIGSMMLGYFEAIGSMKCWAISRHLTPQSIFV